jgi:hypothetical protein
VTVQGKKDLAQITALQDKARKTAEKSWNAVTWTSGHKTPRLKKARVAKARGDDQHVAALEKKRRQAELEAHKPNTGWQGPRRSAPGLLGKG